MVGDPGAVDDVRADDEGGDGVLSLWGASLSCGDPRDGLYILGDDNVWTHLLIPSGGVAFVCGPKRSTAAPTRPALG